MRGTHRATIVALIMMLAVVSGAAHAFASPLSAQVQKTATAKARVDALDQKLQAAAARYDAASKAMSSADSAVAANTRRLNALMSSVDRLQSHLDVRASYMYRTGPLGFLEVLMGSSTFEEFSANWDLLTTLSADDAATIARLRVVRSQALAQGESLLRTQAESAGRLRSLATARAAIQKQLAERQRLLASAQKDLESEQARRAAAGAAADVARPPVDPYTGPTGSGAWSSAVASWYGPGFYGHHMADGEILRPDSMIVANKTLRFGTLIEFKFHGHTAVAKVADRGPYVAGREFDLGPGTARVLHFDGVARVQYRIIGR